MMQKSYRELEVWKAARKIVKTIYLLTSDFPEYEKYCLTQQIRRSAISVPSNIAEGVGRNKNADIIQFLYISRGSLYEVETQSFLAFDLNYFSEDTLNHILNETEQTGKLFSGFIKYYEQKQ